MASLAHNQKTARSFLHDLVLAYNKANPEQQNLLADSLLENMCQRDLADIEGPTYLLASFWDHVRHEADQKGIAL
jgi:hypothetical protein